MRIQLDVCDICRAPDRPVRRYTITRDGGFGTTDLCDEHGEPLEAVLTVAELDPSPEAQSSANGTKATPVKKATAKPKSTVAKKATAKKAATKKAQPPGVKGRGRNRPAVLTMDEINALKET